MGDGGGAQTGFIGEHTAGHALTHSHHHGIAENAAAHGFEAECALEDLDEHGGDIGDTHDDDRDAGQDIKDGHEGHHIGGDLTDALNAADDHDGHDDSQNNTGDQGIQAHQTLHGAGDLAGLGDVADAEGGQTAQNGEDHSQPLPVFSQTVFDIVHGAALVDALIVGGAEFQGKGDLGVFGAHAEESGEPHPEHSAGTADENGAGNTGDITGTYGGGHGSGHSLEGREVGAVILAGFLEKLSDGVPHDITEFGDLDAAGADREENTAAYQQDQHDGTPGEGVQHAVDVFDDLDQFLHTNTSFNGDKQKTAVEMLHGQRIRKQEPMTDPVNVTLCPFA